MQDRDAGRRGLAACAKQMEQYDKCMAKYWQKKPEKLYRVRLVQRSALALALVLRGECNAMQ